MDVTGKFSRTTFDVKFDCYPFANASSFFVTAGFSIGGDKLLKISEHSDELKNLAAQGKEYGIEIGDYQIPGQACCLCRRCGRRLEENGLGTQDDISKFMDYLQVYPVLKLSIRGRIL